MQLHLGIVMPSQLILDQSLMLTDTVRQLNYALRSLDFLGFPLAALHVNNALLSIEGTIPQSDHYSILVLSQDVDFSIMDKMAETLSFSKGWGFPHS
jgi:hypothetical protein